MPLPVTNAVPPADLAAFLCRRREEITAHWMEQIRQNAAIRSADGLDPKELADHLPKLFDDLTDRLRGTSATGEQKHARQHGEHRWQQDYSLTEVVRELGIVCNLVLAHGLGAFQREHPSLALEQVDAARGVILGFFEEITAVSIEQYTRKQQDKHDTLRQKLQAERELLRTVFDQAPDDAIIIMDAQRTLTAWNPAAERITGWTAAEAIGQSADLIFTPEDRAAGGAKQETDLAARDGKATDERWHMRKDGGRFWGSGTMNALHDQEGRVRGYLKVFRDATAQHEEAQTLALLDRVTDAVLGEREPGRIIDVVERMLGEHLKASRVLFAEATEERRQVVVHHAWAPGLPSLLGTHRVADFGEKFLADIEAGRTHVSQDAEADYPPGTALESIRAVGAMASVSVPVYVGGRLQMVVVHQTTPRDWTTSEVALIRQVAGRMVAEVLRARAERSLRASKARGAYLLRLSDALRPVSDPVEVQAVAAQTLGERLGVSRVAYFEISGSDYVIEQDYTSGVVSFAGRHPVAAFGSLILDQLLAGQFVVEADTSATVGRSVPERAAFATLGIRSIATVPLVKGGRFVAGLTAQMIGPRAWSDEDLWTIAETAERTWAAVERARDARVLAENEAKYRALFDSVDSAFCVLEMIWDEAGSPVDYRFVEVNSNFERHNGFVDAEGKTALELVPNLEARWFEIFGEISRSGEPRRFTEGSAAMGRWFDLYAFPLGNDVNRRVAVIFSDISERRRAEDALHTAKAEAEAASRAKDDFLAALSHELRTPLTPVLMAASDLCDDPNLPESVRETLRMMQRNIGLEARLIDDLLDLTRIAKGKLELRAQDCEAHSILGLAVEIVRDEAQAKGIKLRINLNAKQTHFVGDSARVQQVFWNLLKNAVKFTPPGGRVTVRSRDEGERLVIEVDDTGIGLAPESLESIFQPFEQAGLVNNARFGGLGLGLAIAKSIVELHGGTIRAQSAGTGRGATFRVELAGSERFSGINDAEDQSALTLVASDTPPTTSILAPRRLLLVEDHEATLQVLTRLLVRAGYSVVAVASVSAAKAAAADKEFDVVISDVGLPDGTGIELMTDLHAARGWWGIALTGYGMEDDLRRSREAGFVEHLVKPVDFAQLRHAIERVGAPRS